MPNRPLGRKIKINTKNKYGKIGAICDNVSFKIELFCKALLSCQPKPCISDTNELSNATAKVCTTPISTDAKAYGNDSIPVGVPGYFMIDAKQSTKAERDGAIDFLTWLYTSTAGQHFVADPVTKGGMGFIPVYNGFKVQPATFMAREIAKYVAAGKTLEWINTYYPAGLQETVGKVSMQQYFTDKISAADLAKAIQDAWKGSTKTWRGAAK